MQPLAITRIFGKPGGVFEANHRQLVAKAGKMLIQFAVRNMPRLGMGSMRPESPRDAWLSIAALHHVVQPFGARRSRVLRDKHQKLPPCHGSQ